MAKSQEVKRQKCIHSKVKGFDSKVLKEWGQWLSALDSRPDSQHYKFAHNALKSSSRRSEDLLASSGTGHTQFTDIHANKTSMYISKYF